MVDNGHVGHVSHSVTTQKIMWVSQFHTGLGLENIESYFFPVEMLNLLKLFFFLQLKLGSLVSFALSSVTKFVQFHWRYFN